MRLVKVELHASLAAVGRHCASRARVQRLCTGAAQALASAVGIGFLDFHLFELGLPLDVCLFLGSQRLGLNAQ